MLVIKEQNRPFWTKKCLKQFAADCNFVIVLLNIPHLGRGNLADRTVEFIIILLDPLFWISNTNWNKNQERKQLK